MEKIRHLQLGKKGVTDNFIETLKKYFKGCKNVKISILKGAGHDKNKVKKFSEEILEKLGKDYTCRVIGFTIVLKKWRKAKR